MKKMTNETLLEMRERGCSLREIASEAGVSYQAIWKRLRGIHERIEEERIRTEFEKIQKRNHPLNKIKRKYQKEAEQLRVEIERLKDLATYQKQEIKEKEQKYKQAVDDMFGLVETTRNEIAKAKSEARKEFWERLIKKAEIVGGGDYGFTYEIKEDDITDLLKEMEGEE